MQAVLEIIGAILGGVGVFGIFVISDWIAGVNKAMRMGYQAYPKEKRKKKWKWIGIFAIVLLLGILFSWLSITI